MSQITEQIKDRLDMIEIIREYVPSLKKSGANWKAQCPFHQEKTPSFMANPEKGIWHCFGCHKGGDIFGFIKEAEGIEFPDAMRLLAERAGVKLTKQDPQKETERQRALDILKTAAQWYHKALIAAKSGEAAREYVKNRQIADRTRDDWKIGFAPDAWEGVSKYLRSRGFRDDEIARAGLSSQNNSGSYYDRFRNRLMFPISDVHGAIVGFTGRKLNEDDLGGKYINTPESLVYHKSSVLYGLSRAKQAIREQDSVVVVEGNMDCVSSHQAGVENVVASSGTALTQEQVNLIKRFTKNVLLAFDPDSAGQDALARGMEIAWQEDMSIKIIELPEDSDPDDLIKQGVEYWKKAISEARDFMDWILERAESRNDLTGAVGKKNAAAEVLPWIKRMPNMIEQTHYLQLLAGEIKVDESVLRSIIAKSGSSRRREGSIRNNNPSSGAEGETQKRGIRERIIIRLFALFVSNKSSQKIKDDFFPDERYKTLYNSLNKLYDGYIEDLPEQTRDIAREVIFIAQELSESDSLEDREHEARDLIRRLSDIERKKEIERITFEIQKAEQEGNDEKVAEYMRKLKDISFIYAEEKGQQDKQ